MKKRKVIVIIIKSTSCYTCADERIYIESTKWDGEKKIFSILKKILYS